MPHTSPPLPIQAYAPELARRFSLIMAALSALVVRRLNGDPRFTTFFLSLWNRINRAGPRLQRLLARLAAGKLAPPRAPSASTPARRGGPHRPADVIPTRNGWLIRIIGYEAAGLACQLEALLAEAQAIELLALAPTAKRILNPIKRLVGLAPYTVCQRIARPAPAPVARPAPTTKLRFEPPGPFAFRNAGHTWYTAYTPPWKPT